MLELGAPAPPFSLVGLDGAAYRLSDGLAQGPVLLVFFDTTCAACNLALVYYNRLRQAYPQDQWQLWAISQDKLEMTLAYAQRQRLVFPVLLDEPSWPVSKLYDPPSTPTFYLVDSDGRVAAANTGFSKDDLNDLARILAKWLDAEPVVVAEADDGNPSFRPGCAPRHL